RMGIMRGKRPSLYHLPTGIFLALLCAAWAFSGGAMIDKILFEFDEPVVLHLRFAQGRLIDSRFEAFTVQYLFTAGEGVFYLSGCASGLLNARLRSWGAVAGQPITITKRAVANPHSERPVTEYFPRVCEEVRELGTWI